MTYRVPRPHPTPFTHFQGHYRPTCGEPASLSPCGGRGTCLDNAVAETFFATLTVELIHRNPWPTRADVVRAIFDYVETWYNPHRRHPSLGYLSPVAFEASQPSAPSAPKPMTVR